MSVSFIDWLIDWPSVAVAVAKLGARSGRREGVSGGNVMKILGHETCAIFEHYNIENDVDPRERR